MVKIIYLDIDGTLRDDHKGIPSSAVSALEQCRKHEIQIVICTGRNLGSIQNDVMALQTDGIISGGGCYIQYHGEEVFKEHFSMRIIKKVISAAAEWKLSLAMEAERKIYMDHNASLFYRNDFQHKIYGSSKAEQKILCIKNKISYEENFEDIKSDTPKIHKICALGQQAAVEWLEKELEQDAETIQKKKWDGYWYLELLPKGCNKGSAVKKLNRKLGISKRESMSFGDSENDIAMMEATGIAVAVGCGSLAIKKYASSICEPVMEDGIYKELLRRNMITFSKKWKGELEMKKQWWQEEVVYQIYPKSFYDSNNDGIGDLRGITEKLDYLADLGITMLWICPIYQSPMDDNGYDISDYTAIASEFGTMDDLEELIAEAKKRGIKIILDLVINHTSDEHEWFKKALADKDSPYHDYYIFKEGKEKPNNWRSVFGGSVWEKVPGREEYYFHAFGKKQPDLNWENKELRNRLYEMVNWWLDKGIAGFRIDAITFIKKDLTWKSREADGVDGLVKCTKASRNQPGIGTFLHELKECTFDRHKCLTVAEAPGVPYEELGEFIGENGYFSMIFDFRYADLDIASGSEWFKRIEWSVKDLNDKIMASQLAIQKYGWSANFIENHDQPRAATKYLKGGQNNSEAVKTLAAMYFFLRGIPFIYQGQELGMLNFERKSVDEFDDLSSIDQYYRSMEEGYSAEESLHFVNMRSRDNARTPFPWNNERYGGFSDVKPWLGMTEEYPVINAKEQIGKNGSIFEFYKDMIHFRQKGLYRNCFIYGGIEPVQSSENVIAYQRYIEDEVIYCWFNFSNSVSEEILPGREWKVIWQSYGKTDFYQDCLELQPYQSVMLKKN